MSRFKNRKRRSRKMTLRSSRKPLIGITCEVHQTKPFFSEFELLEDYRYVRAVLRAGGIPVLLPINPFGRDINRLLDLLDGIILPGGADLHPSFYGARTCKKVRPTYRGRTYFEIDLYKRAQKKKVPVLAICYGMQLLNVIYGGSLHQDIQTELKHARRHHSKRHPMQRVQIQEGTQLYEIYRQKSFMVHCEHHQAVKILGRSLKATAFAEDGIPEAIEGPPRVIAVQWHPERQPKDALQRRLFSYFIRLAQKRMAAK